MIPTLRPDVALGALIVAYAYIGYMLVQVFFLTN